jgi:non-heme chloroperoxidase
VSGFSSLTREEFIKVEPIVYLHVTDAGEGMPVVLIQGWPLSDEMFEYQYNDLVNNKFRHSFCTANRTKSVLLIWLN